jgi:prepilin-type N-terminal cleavage/methylation domain-containing protein
MRWTPRTPRHPAAAFTLIEMLAVVAILGAVLALAIPAFQHLGQANALSSAGNRTANFIGAARQNSTSRNVLTSLIILTGTGTEADYRTIGLFERGVAGTWSQIGSWESLPTGITFDAGDRINCSYLENSPIQPALTDPNGGPAIRFFGRDIEPSQMAYRVFLPTGSLSNPDQPAQLRLVEGIIEGAGENRSVRYTRRKNRGTANYYDVAIIGATGSPKIIRP